jgi:hypothetical protein
VVQQLKPESSRTVGDLDVLDAARTPDWFRDARRAARRIRAQSAGSENARHHIYVILLEDETRIHPHGLYVGQSFYRPEVRFEQHLAGHRASRIVRRCGLRLLPKLYRHLNPLVQHEALEIEGALAEALREVVPWVEGGH